MEKYVLIFCSHIDSYDAERFIVVQKDRPSWQKGRLNLPGGKIEKGETAYQAAIRELYEETGIANTIRMEESGTVGGEHFIIHCFTCFTTKNAIKPREGETETVTWQYWSDIRHDKNLMPNLRVIIPLMMARQKQWEITDQDGGLKRQRHTITITIPGGLPDEVSTERDQDNQLAVGACE